MGLNQHDDEMDERIRADVTRLRSEALVHEYDIVEDISRSFSGRCCRLLEIGCGSLGLLGRQGKRLADLQTHSIGIDIDQEGLVDNANVAHRVCATSYSLPLQDACVDLIVCRWMFEHVGVPEQALREFRRVLKPGGFVYIKTPNLWNYSMVVSRFTPTIVHNMLRSATGHGENMPTFYRANTRRRLYQLASNCGFSVRRIEAHSYSYMYYMFNRELFLLMAWVSRLIGKVTDRLQLTLMCVLEKT